MSRDAGEIADVIDLRRVRVAFGDRTVLGDIDLGVAPGERIAIVGHNGAGKSTLLKLLAGTVAPVQGVVTVFGRNLQLPMSRHDRTSLNARIGQIFQALQLVPRLTVLENVLVGSLARNRTLRSWARIFPDNEIDHARAALRAVGLQDRGHVRADQLSGGERQKTAIARMLLQRPRLILADEPTSALDPTAAARIAALLSAMARRDGLTMITVVHDPALLPRVADRVVGMDSGRIVFDVPVASITPALLHSLYGMADAANRATIAAPDFSEDRFHECRS